MRSGRILASLLFSLTGSLARVSAGMGLPSEAKIEPVPGLPLRVTFILGGALGVKPLREHMPAGKVGCGKKELTLWRSDLFSLHESCTLLCAIIN